MTKLDTPIKNREAIRQLASSNERIDAAVNSIERRANEVQSEITTQNRHSNEALTQLSDFAHNIHGATETFQKILSEVVMLQSKWQGIQNEIEHQAEHQTHTTNSLHSIFSESEEAATQTHKILHLVDQLNLLTVNMNIELEKETLDKDSLLPISERLKQLSLNFNNQHQRIFKLQNNLYSNIQHLIEETDQRTQPTESLTEHTTQVSTMLKCIQKELNTHHISLSGTHDAISKTQQLVSQSCAQLEDIAKKVANIMRSLEQLKQEAQLISNDLLVQLDRSTNK